MDLIYTSLDATPTIVGVIESNGIARTFPMLLDTGSDHTCFPVFFAKMLGHNNHHPGVRVSSVLGVGGREQSYLHTINVGIASPDYKAGQKLRPCSTVWNSSIAQFRFGQKFMLPFGLIGRDVMKEWKAVSISPYRGKWAIKITI